MIIDAKVMEYELVFFEQIFSFFPNLPYAGISPYIVPILNSLEARRFVNTNSYYIDMYEYS